MTEIRDTDGLRLPPTIPATAAGDHALRVIVEERIAELLMFRRWYRKNRWADWPVLRQEHDTELRALVRLARKARAVARCADRPDPIDQYKADRDRGLGYHDTQAS